MDIPLRIAQPHRRAHATGGTGLPIAETAGSPVIAKLAPITLRRRRRVRNPHLAAPVTGRNRDFNGAATG
jgi:hypothetical protein